jgi:hypothetical protein
MTLPNVNTIASGIPLDIEKVSADANQITIVPQGGALIQGSANLIILSQWDSVTLYNDGVNWFIN